MAMKARPLAERFWEKVNKNGPVPPHRPELGPCWIWTAAIHVRTGYGLFAISRCKMLGAHRVAWHLSSGEEPGDMQVLHKCDNRACVNPGHLFLGTHDDNMQDKASKGRAPRGDLNGAHKHRDRMRRGDEHGSVTHPEAFRKHATVTPADVVKMRRLYGDGVPVKKIAEEIGCSYGVAYNAVRGLCWKRVS